MEMGSINGLNLGRKIYLEENATTEPAAGPAGSNPSPRRKTKGGGQPPRCQVEGCHMDLSDAKAYYRRHKVCGTHSKSPLVIVGGIEQRFCQQCSRFHLVCEFDQGKRSCRRRLAGHNERRRKPPISSSWRFSGTCTSFGGSAFDLMDFTTAISSSSSSSRQQLAGHGCSWTAPTTPAWRGHQVITAHANVGDQCHNAAQADHSTCSSSSSALSLLSTHQHQPWPWGSTPGGNNNNMMLLQHQRATPPHSGGGYHHFQGISFEPGLGLSKFYPEGVNLGPEGSREYLGLQPSRAFRCSSHQMHCSL